MFGGRRMARVISSIFAIFILVPMIAPSIGGVLLALGRWQWLFWFLFIVSFIVMIWTSMRLPETRPAYKRKPFSATALLKALTTLFTTRQNFGYSLAMMFMFGFYLSYLNSVKQIFSNIYGVNKSFPIYFAIIACWVVIGLLVNNRIVIRLGMRLISHSALITIMVVGGLVMVAALFRAVPLAGFCVALGSVFFAHPLVMANFNALAMQKVGHIGGMASSFIGFTQTAGGAMLGYLVGQAYNHTIIPLSLGFVIFAVAALCAVLFAERGRLMNSQD